MKIVSLQDLMKVKEPTLKPHAEDGLKDDIAESPIERVYARMKNDQNKLLRANRTSNKSWMTEIFPLIKERLRAQNI